MLRQKVQLLFSNSSHYKEMVLSFKLHFNHKSIHCWSYAHFSKCWKMLGRKIKHLIKISVLFHQQCNGVDTAIVCTLRDNDFKMRVTFISWLIPGAVICHIRIIANYEHCISMIRLMIISKAVCFRVLYMHTPGVIQI